MSKQHRPVHLLRSVTNRISATPADQLPPIAPHLANSVALCKSLLSDEIAGKGKQASDHGVLVHKFKTQVTALLQDKRAEARWAGAVLVKAAVTAGGVELVHGQGVSVRALLSLLGKTDPPSTKRIAILTLTKIFLLTHGHPAVLREVTTPSLPTFITNCLNSVSKSTRGTEKKLVASSSLLRPVLQSFITLIPSHPAIFRTFVRQIRTLLAGVVAPTPSQPKENVPGSGFSVTQDIVSLAQRLHALLCHCAPKNGVSEDWAKQVAIICVHANRTADCIFRSYKEQNRRNTAESSSKSSFGNAVQDAIEDDLSLPAWRGVEAGTERLVGVLGLLTANIASQSSGSYSLPVAEVWALVDRITSVLAPSVTVPDAVVISQTRPEVERSEKDALWMRMQEIHSAALCLLSCLVERMGLTAIAVAHTILEKLAWLYKKDLEYGLVRQLIYRIATNLIRRVGRTTPKKFLFAIRILFQGACSECVDRDIAVASHKMVTSVLGSSANEDVERVFVDTIHSSSTISCSEAAAAFVTTTLEAVPASSWPGPVRILLERTVLLGSHKQGLVAAVLEPQEKRGGQTASSLMPFAARAFPQSQAIEAMLRPRVPLLATHRDEGNLMLAKEDSEEPGGPALDMDLDMEAGGYSLTDDKDEAKMALEVDSNIPATTLATIQSPKRPRDSNDGLFEEVSLLPARKTAGGEAFVSSTSLNPPKLAGEPAIKKARVDESAMEIDDSNTPLPVAVDALLTPHVEPPITSGPGNSGGVRLPSSDRAASSGPERASPEPPERSKADDDDSDTGSSIPPIVMDSSSDDEEEE